MATKIFTSGFVPKYPFPGAPKWVKINVGIKVDDFIDWLKKHKQEGKEWLDITISEGQTPGKLYGALNTYKKGGEEKVKGEDTNREQLNNEEIIPEEIPF